jgi:hypothetical protein
VTRQSESRAQASLRAVIGPTEACVPIDHFGALSEAEQQHVSQCAHCEAELALWQEFEAQIPADREGAAVNWIAAEVGRRRGTNAVPASLATRFRWFGLPGFAVAAATLALVAGLAYAVRDREPALKAPTASEIYRGTEITGLSPVGNVYQVPDLALKWSSLPGADRYDVSVLEVDGTVLWHTSTSNPEAVLPRDVVSKLVPGKSVTWEVTARDRSGALIAASGTQRLTVVPRS